jgi:hypothetical protein
MATARSHLLARDIRDDDRLMSDDAALADDWWWRVQPFLTTAVLAVRQLERASASTAIAVASVSLGSLSCSGDRREGKRGARTAVR